MYARTATTLIQIHSPNLRRSAFRPSDAVRLALLLQEPVSHAWACELGDDTEFLILDSVHSYILNMTLFQASHLPITILPEFSESPAKRSQRLCVKTPMRLHLYCSEYLSERPAASVWSRQADIISVHWTELNHVGMIRSYDLLFVSYYRIARSTIHVLWVDVPYVGQV
ncbi:hypothetical protein M405DRAFT_433672 [Rhizopogon salebrosus TDB-379]|nr:hypothetical protein M405DRAFT_433672 [Rhizopogon salebrosus TDB-379]